MLSRVHPPLTMEGEGEGWREDSTAGHGGPSMGLDSLLHSWCVCLCVSELAPSRLVTRFLRMGKYCTRTHRVIELVCLELVQGLAMKSAWESSRGPGQDTKTKTERGRDCRVAIKFHSLFARPSPPLTLCTLFPLPSNLSFRLLKEPGTTFPSPTRSRQHASHCEFLICLQTKRFMLDMLDLTTSLCSQELGCARFLLSVWKRAGKGFQSRPFFPLLLPLHHTFLPATLKLSRNESEVMKGRNKSLKEG